MTKDRRLGKGLAALLGTPLEEDGSHAGKTLTAAPHASTASQPESPIGSPPSSPTAPRRIQKEPAVETSQPAGANSPTTVELNVDEIDNNPFQPRRKFNEEEIGALAESIREHQQLQPVLVRKVGSRYQLISGERRLRATIHAGLPTIRAEVRVADDRLVAELAIVENLQRKDLDAIEKALSFRRYIDEHKCKQEDLAKRLKIDRSTIANLMRLLELPTDVQQWIQSERITAGHARALLPLDEEEQQVEFAQQIMTDGWSVRETERRVREQVDAEDGLAIVGSGNAPPKPSKRSTPQIAALEQQLRLALGTKTEIRQNARGRGKISISFANADEFERICSLLSPQPLRKAA